MASCIFRTTVLVIFFFLLFLGYGMYRSLAWDKLPDGSRYYFLSIYPCMALVWNGTTMNARLMFFGLAKWNVASW